MLLLLPLSMFPFWIIIFGQLNFNWKSMVGSEKTACHVSGEEQTCLNPPSQAHPQFPTSNYSWDGAKSLSCKSWFRLHPAEVTRFRYPFLVKRCSSAVPHTTVGKAAQQPAGARKCVGRSLPAPNGFLNCKYGAADTAVQLRQIVQEHTKETRYANVKPLKESFYSYHVMLPCNVIIFKKYI